MLYYKSYQLSIFCFIMTTRFSVTKPINQKNLAGVPTDKPGVYRIKDKDNKILYIGVATEGRLNDRIFERRGNIPGGTTFQYRVTKTGEAAQKLEKVEMRKYIFQR